jgi:hypothetical protein
MCHIYSYVNVTVPVPAVTLWIINPGDAVVFDVNVIPPVNVALTPVGVLIITTPEPPEAPPPFG